MEYYIDKQEKVEYSDKNKRKFIIKWKNDEYSTYIDDTYLKDKILTLDNLEEFFDSIFNEKKYYGLDCYYDLYYLTPDSIQLNISVEMKISDKLKTLKQNFVFNLHKIDKRSIFQWFTDIILNRD